MLIVVWCVQLDVEAGDNAEVEELKPTEDTVRTEHEATGAQQVDAAHGVAGTSEEHDGKEVGVCVYFVTIIGF